VAAGVAAGVSLALSALTAGYLLARFGPRTERRHAAFAGLYGAAELWLMVLLSGGFQAAFLGASTFLMLACLGVAFCVLGAWLRRRQKPSTQSRA
jgi:apolipoprotein N-acyltransferase